MRQESERKQRTNSTGSRKIGAQEDQSRCRHMEDEDPCQNFVSKQTGR